MSQQTSSKLQDYLVRFRPVHSVKRHRDLKFLTSPDDQLFRFVIVSSMSHSILIFLEIRVQWLQLCLFYKIKPFANGLANLAITPIITSHNHAFLSTFVFDRSFFPCTFASVKPSAFKPGRWLKNWPPFALVRYQNFKIYFSSIFEKFDKPYRCKFILQSSNSTNDILRETNTLYFSFHK